MSENSIISFNQVSLGYPDRPPLLQKVSLDLVENGFYFLTGPSGCGKTTLFKSLLMLLDPLYGSISIMGEKTRGLSAKQRASLRRDMGVVFQDNKLLDHLSVLDNVALPLHIRGFETKEVKKRADELLAWMGLKERAALRVSELSGGEKQRVAIARAVLGRPKIVLADEPTGHIDDVHGIQALQFLDRLHKAGTTVIVATHHQKLIQQFTHPVLCFTEKGLLFFQHPSAYQDYMRQQRGVA